MNSLVKYESARFALQQAAEIDEVKNIRDKAQAMAAYARQANDTKLVEWATEIKVRAERKAGQMLADMPKNPGNLKNSSWSHDATTTKLSDLGINKTQSSRWQKLAAVPEDQFEQAVAAAKEVAGEVTTAAMLRIEKENRKTIKSEQSDIKEEIKGQSQNYIKNNKVNIENDTEKYDPKEDALHEAQETINHLADENTKLRDALAAGQLPEDEIIPAEKLIIELRANIKALEAELDAVKSSRDIYQRENAELKAQCKIYQNMLKKSAGNAKA